MCNGQLPQRLPLPWHQLDSFAERGHSAILRRRAFMHVKKPKIEIGLGHFGIDGDGALVLGASLVGFHQRGVNVSKLEVRVSEFGSFADKLLQRRNGGFEFLFVNEALRFIKQVVERVRNFSRLRLHGRFGLSGLRVSRRWIAL